MTNKEFYNIITGNNYRERISKKIYAYESYKDYKYIIAFHSPSRFSEPYTAMHGTNKKFEAMRIAFTEHLRDGLEWVVIQNY